MVLKKVMLTTKLHVELEDLFKSNKRFKFFSNKKYLYDKII